MELPSASRVESAVDLCLASDPVSVFGGIVAINQPINGSAAESLNKVFLECVVAPSFSKEAMVIFEKKKNLRLLQWPGMGLRDDFWKIQTIQGGFLVQQSDRVHLWDAEWKIMGEQPSPEIRADLSFAWALAASLKSNAIAIAENKQSLGLGMGQVNRVDAVKLAIERMQKFHPQTKNPVLASDAFSPLQTQLILFIGGHSMDHSTRWLHAR